MGSQKLIGTTSRDRAAIAREADLSSLSLTSVLAGTLSAYGVVAIVAVLAGAVLDRANVNVDLSSRDWTSSVIVGCVGVAASMLLAFGFGGYVAGRMAARSGLAHGVAVAVLGTVSGVALGAAFGALSDAPLASDLHIVAPSATSWSAISWINVAVALAAVVVGALCGAILGLRWHTRFVRRLADPSIGASADARRHADALEADRTRYVGAVAEPDSSSGSEERARDEDVIDLRSGAPDRGSPARPRSTLGEVSATSRRTNNDPSGPRSRSDDTTDARVRRGDTA